MQKSKRRRSNALSRSRREKADRGTEVQEDIEKGREEGGWREKEGVCVFPDDDVPQR